MDTSSLERNVADSKSAESPGGAGPIVVPISVNGPRRPDPGSLVNATVMVTVISKSRVPIGFMGSQSVSLIGST